MGLGVLSVIVAVVLLILGANPPSTLPTVLGVFLLTAGIVVGGVGGLLRGMASRQRRVLLLPLGPPTQTTGPSPRVR